MQPVSPAPAIGRRRADRRVLQFADSNRLGGIERMLEADPHRLGLRGAAGRRSHRSGTRRRRPPQDARDEIDEVALAGGSDIHEHRSGGRQPASPSQFMISSQRGTSTDSSCGVRV